MQRLPGGPQDPQGVLFRTAEAGQDYRELQQAYANVILRGRQVAGVETSAVRLLRERSSQILGDSSPEAEEVPEILPAPQVSLQLGKER